MKNLIVRTVTGIFFVAALVISFTHPYIMVPLFALITGLTIWEFTGLVNQRKGVHTNRFITTMAGIFLFLAMAVHSLGLDTYSIAFVPFLITIVYLLVAELYLKAEDPISNWAFALMAQLYIALPFSLLNVLAFQFSQGGASILLLPLSVFIFLWTNDTGAYCCGSLLGRHKLFPRISPGKSWEGSIGGGVLVIAVACFIAYYTEQHDIETYLTMLQWAGLGLTVVIFGTWGDLVESLFKRTLGVKDSGHLLPGHGGMLDRFDSSLLAIPAAVVYLFTLALL